MFSPASSPAFPPARAPSSRRSGGFTLLELTFCSILVIGLITGVMQMLQLHQMMQRGDALGQRMAALARGVERYLRDHGPRIVELDRACAEFMSPDATRRQMGHHCTLLVDGQAVLNGYQPTVEELARLRYVTGDDRLTLPHARELVKDKRSGEPLSPRLAVLIEQVPARSEPSASDENATALDSAEPPPDTDLNATGDAPARLRRAAGDDGSGARAAAARQASSAPPIATFADGQDHRLPVEYNASGLMAQLLGVDCSSKEIVTAPNLNEAGRFVAFPRITANRLCNDYSVGAVNDLDLAPWWNYWTHHHGRHEPLTLYGIDCKSTQPASYAATQGLLRWDSGVAFCSQFMKARLPSRQVQALYRHWHGLDSPKTPAVTAEPAAPPWALRATVFNTQPYHAGARVPYGAGPQLAAALLSTGHAGRLILPGTAASEALQMQGLSGTAPEPNPVRTEDGQGGVPGILAAVVRVHAHDAAVSRMIAAGAGAGPVDCGPNSPMMCRDGSNAPTAGWDFARQNIENAGALEAQNMFTGYLNIATEAKRSQPLVSQAESTLGRVLEVRGDLTMSRDSFLRADHAAATELKVVTGHANMVVIGTQKEGKPLLNHANGRLFVHNGAVIRLPRAMPGSRCGHGDLALSYPGQLVPRKAGESATDHAGTAPQPARIADRQYHRFLLYCGISELSLHTSHENVWRSHAWEQLSRAHPRHEWQWHIPLDPADAYDGNQRPGAGGPEAMGLHWMGG